MMKVHAESRGGGNAGYTAAAAQQMSRQLGVSRADARTAVQGNIRGTTGAGSGRPMRRGNFIPTR